MKAVWMHEYAVRFVRSSHSLEHVAVAVYSTCEVFGFHAMIWYISASLIVIATSGFIYEIKRTKFDG